MLKLDPTSTVFVHLAEEFSSRSLWQETADVCRRGLVHHPSNFRGRVLLGLALKNLGESQEAMMVLTEARREIEKSVLVYKILAEVAEEAGDSAQAEYLSHIYRVFQGEEPKLSTRIQPRRFERIPETSVPTPPPAPMVGVEENLLRALTHLLERINSKAPTVTPSERLFSKAAREDLKKLLSTSIS
jgi:hypothetical protein